MARNYDLVDFVEAGHATTGECTGTTEPVTLSGYYQQRNSAFSYYFGWNNGRLTVSPVGYSAEYLNAQREAERVCGPALDEVSHERQMQYIAKKLGL